SFFWQWHVFLPSVIMHQFTNHDLNLSATPWFGDSFAMLSIFMDCRSNYKVRPDLHRIVHVFPISCS
ncbi:MAG: hypothetical protein VYE00_10495, partial [Candidatus Poribacteria bacterium]|nr:hypothetical protein [Candidatus Poribacteria bacterium]